MDVNEQKIKKTHVFKYNKTYKVSNKELNKDSSIVFIYLKYKTSTSYKDTVWSTYNKIRYI
jgi:hypothetical protein